MQNRPIRRLRFAGVIYATILAITAANYSFLTFTYQGEKFGSGAFEAIAFLRLPLAILGCLLLASGFPRSKFRVLSGSGPIIAVALLSVVAVPVAENISTAAIYSLWWSTTLLFLVMYSRRLTDELGEGQAAEALAIPLALYSAYFLVLGLGGLPRYTLGNTIPLIYSTPAKAAIVAPFFLGALIVVKPRFRRRAFLNVLLFGLVLFSILLIAVSGKRMAMLATLFIGAAWLVFRIKVSGKLVMLLLVPLIAVILAAIPEVRENVNEVVVDATEHSSKRIEKSFDDERSTSVNARKQAWSLALTISWNRPLGVGFANGSIVLGGGIHNSYLGYLLEVGWLGFAAVMVVVVRTLLVGIWSRSHQKRDMLLFIFLPAAMFHFSEYNTAPGQILFMQFWVAATFISTSSRDQRI